MGVIPPDLLRKIRRIEIRVRRLLNTTFLGDYHSVFRGRGIEFSEVREYFPGDDIRSIDWNVTARMGYPYIKQFVEERELTVILAVDVSASGQYGSTGQSKLEVATEIAALLAFSAIRNNDKVGLLAFTDRVEKFVPPRKGRQHVLRVIRELLYLRPKGRGTDLGPALAYVSRVQRRKCVVFLISDFLTSGYESTLRVAGRRHDVIAVSLTDPRERELPAAGLVTLEDAETGAVTVVDAGDPGVRDAYRRLAVEAEAKRIGVLNSVGIDRVDIVNGRSYVEPLAGFFRSRAKRN
ncbi:MAG: DUF58 domain-containing protein [Dehalococcoidia bacterium]|nr:DUF58 domain-containing protein [Dehalococcoidia bacterium]